MARRVRSGSSSSTASNLSSSPADSCCSSSSSDSDGNPTRVQWGPQRTPEKNWLRRVRKKDSREFVRRQSLGWDRSLRDRLESDQDESSSGADDDDDNQAATNPRSANTSLLEEEDSIGGDSQATERPTISPSVTTRRGARNPARVSSLRQDDTDSADSDGQDDAVETSDDEPEPASAPAPVVKEEPVEQTIPQVASPVKAAAPSTPARASRPSRSPSPTSSPAPAAPSPSYTPVRVKEEPVDSTDDIPLGLVSAAPGSPTPEELPADDPPSAPGPAPIPPAARENEVAAGAPADATPTSPSVEPSPEAEAELSQPLETSALPEAVLTAAAEDDTPAAEAEKPAQVVEEEEGGVQAAVPSEEEETLLEHLPEGAPEQPLALAPDDETPDAEDLATPVDLIPLAVIPVALEEEEDLAVPDQVSLARDVKEEVLSDEEVGNVSTVSAADVIVDEATPPELVVEAAPSEAPSATPPAAEELLEASSPAADEALVEEPLPEALVEESPALPATSLAEGAPVEDAAVEATSLDNTPVEEPSVEGTSVGPAPVDVAPVEGSPVEGVSIENGLEAAAPSPVVLQPMRDASKEAAPAGEDAALPSTVEDVSPSVAEVVPDVPPSEVVVEEEVAPAAVPPAATDVSDGGTADNDQGASPVGELRALDVASASEREGRLEEQSSPAKEESLLIGADASPPAATEALPQVQEDEAPPLEESAVVPAPAPSPSPPTPALDLPSPAEATPAAPATPVARPATPLAAPPAQAPTEMTPGVRFAPKITSQSVASSSRLTSTRSTSPRSDSASSNMSTPPANRKAAKPPSPEKAPIARSIRSRIAKATPTADHSSESLIARLPHASSTVLPSKEPVLPSPITRPSRTLATSSEAVATSRPLRTSRITPPSSRLRAPEPSGLSTTSSSAAAGSASGMRRPLRPTVAVQTPVAPEAAPAAPSAPKRKPLQPTTAGQAPLARAPRARKPVVLPPAAAPASAAVAQISDAKLQSITQLNTRNNQAYFSPMEKVVVRKEGENRPESPGPKVKKVLPKASLGKGRALFDPPPAEGDDSADDSEADRPTPKKHMRGPGDLEDYESPMKLPRSALKGSRAAKLVKGPSGLPDGAALAASRAPDDKYSVRWNKGLVLIRSRNSTAPEPQHRARPTGPKPAIKPIPVLDAFGNLEPTVPLTQLIKRSLVTYTQIIYDDDLPPPPAATKKGRK